MFTLDRSSPVALANAGSRADGASPFVRARVLTQEILRLLDAAFLAVDHTVGIALEPAEHHLHGKTLGDQLHHRAAIDRGEIAISIADRLSNIGRAVAGFNSDVQPLFLEEAIGHSDIEGGMVVASHPVHANRDLLQILRIRHASAESQGRCKNEDALRREAAGWQCDTCIGSNVSC